MNKYSTNQTTDEAELPATGRPAGESNGSFASDHTELIHLADRSTVYSGNY